MEIPFENTEGSIRAAKLWGIRNRSISLLDSVEGLVPTETKGKISVVIKVPRHRVGNTAVLGRCKFVQEQVYRVCN